MWYYTVEGKPYYNAEGKAMTKEMVLDMAVMEWGLENESTAAMSWLCEDESVTVADMLAYKDAVEARMAEEWGGDLD